MSLVLLPLTAAWEVPPQAKLCGDKPGCIAAQGSATTVIPGAVFSSAMDGGVRAYSTKDGSIVWDFNTVREYETVNKVAAKGGSIDGPGATIVDGMVFTNSGYSQFGGIPGNVLLAFGVE